MAKNSEKTLREKYDELRHKVDIFQTENYFCLEDNGYIL